MSFLFTSDPPEDKTEITKEDEMSAEMEIMRNEIADLKDLINKLATKNNLTNSPNTSGKLLHRAPTNPDPEDAAVNPVNRSSAFQRSGSQINNGPSMGTMDSYTEETNALEMMMSSNLNEMTSSLTASASAAANSSAGILLQQLASAGLLIPQFAANLNLGIAAGGPGGPGASVGPGGLQRSNSSIQGGSIGASATAGGSARPDERKLIPNPAKLKMSHVSQSVLKIYTTTVQYDYSKPWSPVKAEQISTGSGFVMVLNIDNKTGKVIRNIPSSSARTTTGANNSNSNGNGKSTVTNSNANIAKTSENTNSTRSSLSGKTSESGHDNSSDDDITRHICIVTNAHVVAQATYIEIRRAGEDTKFVASVSRVLHDIDLAILTIDSEKDRNKFQNQTEPLELGETPYMGDTVHSFGFPIGGEEMSFTKGIVSRVELSVAAHSGRMVLSVDTDTSIAPGNSGGPVLSVDGRIAGVSFQGISNKDGGFFIAATVLENAIRVHCLEDKDWRVPDLGIAEDNLENGVLREYFGVPEDVTGILVRDVAAFSVLKDKIRPYDVLTKVNGYSLANNGTVQFRVGERTTWLFSYMQCNLGETIEIEFLRCLDKSRRQKPRSTKNVKRSEKEEKGQFRRYGPADDDSCILERLDGGEIEDEEDLETLSKEDESECGSGNSTKKKNLVSSNSNASGKKSSMKSSVSNSKSDSSTTITSSSTANKFAHYKATIKLKTTKDDVAYSRALLWDLRPEYVIRAGLVFQPLSLHNAEPGGFRIREKPELIYLMRAFKTPLLAGINEASIEGIGIFSINGVEIFSLEHVLEAFDKPLEKEMLLTDDTTVTGTTTTTTDSADSPGSKSNSTIDSTPKEKENLGSKESKKKKNNMKAYHEIMFNDGRKLLMEAVEVERITDSVMKKLSISPDMLHHIRKQGMKNDSNVYQFKPKSRSLLAEKDSNDIDLEKKGD